MLRHISPLSSAVSLLLLGTLPAGGLADQILKTEGFSTCLSNPNITVQRSNVEYNNDNKQVTFDVAGTSTQEINVTATIKVSAYGNEVYTNSFNPCDKDTLVAQLCPVPEGTFAAKGVQTIPESYAKMIPSIAFSIPDIAAKATIQLKALDGGKDIACITSTVNNGKTASVPAIPYVAAGIAGAALLLTGASALGAAASGGSVGGSGTPSPSFTEVVTWFQGMAMNGMMSANLPPIYRSFTKNFAFSTGIIPWTSMQESIDSFRNVTGGNLTTDSVQFLKNATLVYSDGSNATTPSKMRRGLAVLVDSLLAVRDELNTSINDTADAAAEQSTSTVQHTVSGIQAYVEQLSVPQSNTFMTVLLVAAVVIAAIAVGILLFKVILETWALFGNFPQGLTGFRKHYWRTMARTIVNLILILYGIWVLYCVFQFTHGDSWAAQTLAGVTLALFTGILGFFTFKIWQTARKLKQLEGDASGLYDDKEHWLKYSIFYDSYKKDFWWIFVPIIVYMAAKGCVLAAADGHGLTQTIAQLAIEALMLGLLIWHRPFERKSGNVINIFIQVVRVLSVVCILVFVEELGIDQTTQTVTGVVLIAVQSGLTGLLAILIAVNAIILCCKENPHRKRRKEAEKLNRDLDNLTPLDARNSLLMDPARMNTAYDHDYKNPIEKQSSTDSFMNEPSNPYSGSLPLRPYGSQHRAVASMDSHENLMTGAAPLGGVPGPGSPPRQPTVPNLGNGNGEYRRMGY